MALNPSLTDWHGKTVWLIGASSGIGQATASALHARGARVIVSARNAAALQAFEQAHPGSRALALDSTDAAQVAAVSAQVFAELAPGQTLDLVLYCAGYYKQQRATDYQLSEMLRHLQVNYTGALYMLDAVLPRLLAQGSGHISLVSTVAGYRGLPKSLA